MPEDAHYHARSQTADGYRFTGLFPEQLQELNDVCQFEEDLTPRESRRNRRELSSSLKNTRCKELLESESLDGSNWEQVLAIVRQHIREIPRAHDFSFNVQPQYGYPVAKFDTEDFTSNVGRAPCATSQQVDEEDGFIESGRPARLLHIPSMTSFPWRPGNVYGRAKEPLYNALSYTWGRWQVRPGETGLTKKQLKIPRLDVDVRPKKEGTPVWDVPRVYPIHFSAYQFKLVLKNMMTELHHDNECESNSHAKGEGKVEFVWVDIACIDQRNGREKAREVGRQAKIFRGAHHVFVWHTTLNAALMEDILSTMIVAGCEAARINDAGVLVPSTPPWIEAATSALKILLSDWWWTSLWTLQEAFLSPNAVFLSKDVRVCRFVNPASIAVQGNARKSFVKLGDLTSACEKLAKTNELSAPIFRERQRSVSRHPALKEAEERHREQWIQNGKSPESFPHDSDWCRFDLEKPPIIEDLERYSPLCTISDRLAASGILAMHRQNPMQIYQVSNKRRTTLDWDYVYGIQQVFEFSLGSSRPGADPDKPWTRERLENQLGAELLRTHPVQSQLHVFDADVESSRGWRLNKTSRVPELVLGKDLWHADYAAACRLTVCAAEENLAWGHFEGLVCDFEVLVGSWRRADELTSIKHADGHGADLSIQKIELDLCHMTAKICDRYQPVVPGPWNRAGAARGRLQYELADAMIRETSLKPIQVLLLGEFTFKEDYATHVGHERGGLYKAGLLLIPRGQHWLRVGIVMWEIGHLGGGTASKETNSVLYGENTCWTCMRGLFG